MRKQAVRIGSRKFHSMTQARIDTGVALSTISYRCHAKTSRMESYQLLAPIQPNRKKIKKGVMVVAGGLRFLTLAAAAYRLNITATEVRRRIKSDRYTSYFCYNIHTGHSVTL